MLIYATVQFNPSSVWSTFTVNAGEVGLLVGPDNRNDYVPIAYCSMGDLFHMTPFGGKVRRALRCLFGFEGEPGNGFDIFLSRECLLCGRLLTVPRSVISGIGPECEHKTSLRSPIEIGIGCLELRKYPRGHSGKVERIDYLSITGDLFIPPWAPDRHRSMSVIDLMDELGIKATDESGNPDLPWVRKKNERLLECSDE